MVYRLASRGSDIIISVIRDVVNKIKDVCADA